MSSNSCNGSIPPNDSSKKISSPTAPPLSPSDFRVMNRLSQRMASFHNHFRSQWTAIRTTLNSPSTDSSGSLLSLIHSFVTQLTMHHNIEETYIFPLLGSRMPEFQESQIMKSQHKIIHDGLENLAKVAGVEGDVGGSMGEWGFEEDEGRWGARVLGEEAKKEIQKAMDGFEKVLWEHLDGEVEALGAENMRKYWSVDEIRRFPM